MELIDVLFDMSCWFEEPTALFCREPDRLIVWKRSDVMELFASELRKL